MQPLGLAALLRRAGAAHLPRSRGVKPSRGRASTTVWHPFPQPLLSPWRGCATRKQKPSGVTEGPWPRPRCCSPQQALGTAAGRSLAPCIPVHPGHSAARLTWSAGLPVCLQNKGGCVVRGIGAVPVDEDQPCPAVRLIPAVALVLFHGCLWKPERKGNLAMQKAAGKAKRTA